MKRGRLDVAPSEGDVRRQAAAPPPAVEHKTPGDGDLLFGTMQE
jgi:hypothetical protein